MALDHKLNRLYHPSLSIPHTEEYGHIESIGSEMIITHTKDGKVDVRKINLDNTKSIEDDVKKEIQKIFKNKNKLIATSFTEEEKYKTLAPNLWLDEDIVSFLLTDKENKESVGVEENIRLVSSSFDSDNIAQVNVSKDYEVEVKDLVTLNDYKKTCSKGEFSTLLSLSKKFKGKKLAFISATPQGGGVALMRHALIRLYKLLGVDAHWFVLKPDLKVFNITKRKFHNVLQGVANEDVVLTDNDKNLYNKWIKENSKLFNRIFKQFDIFVIDDPQPCGLIPYIKKANPKCKIIYRSHIHLDALLANEKGTPQFVTWKFLWSNIKKADLFVSHPVADFVPQDVDRNKLIYAPATTDPLDGLNKPLSERHMNYYMNLFNKFVAEEGQTPLDLRRPYIIQIARFDPSKGIPHVLNSYLKLTKLLKNKGHKIPQLIITGNGSVDDPDRAPIFDETMKTLKKSEYKKIKDDVKVVRLPHIDQLLNTLLRRSKIVLQLSTKEGFEIKVTEALMKGKPVIVFRAGGMPLQIMDKVNGLVIDIGDTDAVAKNMYHMFTNNTLYGQMSKSALKFFDRSLLTVPNSIKWLRMSISLTGDKK